MICMRRVQAEKQHLILDITYTIHYITCMKVKDLQTGTNKERAITRTRSIEGEGDPTCLLTARVAANTILDVLV